MRRTAPAVAAALALGCASSPAAATTAWTDCVPGHAARTAGGLTAMWHSLRGRGWTGGDATWSVRLPDGRTAWLFGDTYLGGRGPGASFVRHSLVVEFGSCLTTVPSSRRQAPVRGADARHWYWPAQPI